MTDEEKAESGSDSGSDVREITLLEENIEPPPVVRESKYPWRQLYEADPLEQCFFVECGSREEAKTLRSSVYSSGKNYYLKRQMELIPVTRVIQHNGSWGVMAWAKLEDQEEEE